MPATLNCGLDNLQFVEIESVMYNTSKNVARVLALLGSLLQIAPHLKEVKLPALIESGWVFHMPNHLKQVKLPILIEPEVKLSIGIEPEVKRNDAFGRMITLIWLILLLFLSSSLLS